MPPLKHYQLYACGREGGEVAGLVTVADGIIHWTNPGGRTRSYQVDEVLLDTPEVYAFRDMDGRRFNLTPLTAAVYNAIRLPGAEAYTSDDELLTAFWSSLGWDAPPSDD